MATKEEKNLEELKDSFELMHETADKIQSTERFPTQLPEKNPWGISEAGKKKVKKAIEMYQTKHGLYASIPFICQGENCIYAGVDPLHKEGLYEEGERCLTEVAFILTKYDAYKNELGIKDEDAVDQSLMRDLIDYDVQILRAETIMAKQGTFVQDVVVGISDSGQEITQEQISMAAQYKEKIQQRRNKTLELLNSTRKDKQREVIADKMDPSSYAASLMKQAEKVRRENEEGVIEAEFEEFDSLEKIPDVASSYGETEE